MRWLLVLTLVACGNDHGDPAVAPDAPVADSLDLYRESCAGCHGPEGDGTVDGPQLRNPVTGFATYVIRNGRGREMGFANEMPAFTPAVLPDADLTAILEWLARPPHPTEGLALYTRYCGNCHGADAQGGRVDEDITRETDEIEEKVRHGHGGTTYSARTKYMPAWPATQLSNADLDAIAAYLGTLPRGPGDDDDDDDDDDD